MCCRPCGDSKSEDEREPCGPQWPLWDASWELLGEILEGLKTDTILYTLQYYTVLELLLYCTALDLYDTILYTIQFYIILYCTLVYYTILFYTIL